MSINGIEVTDVVVYPIKNKPEGSKLQAFAKIVINDQFIVNGLRIVEGVKGAFVAFPQEYKKADEKSYDIAFPITAELRTYMTEIVLSQYEIALHSMAA